MAAVESMEEWLRTVLEERHWMDGKVLLAEGRGTLEFRGPLPHLNLIERQGAVGHGLQTVD